jgi:hypothetical protein
VEIQSLDGSLVSDRSHPAVSFRQLMVRTGQLTFALL